MSDAQPEKPPRTDYNSLRNSAPGNSKKQKAAGEQSGKKEIKPIAEGQVTQRKPPLGRRIMATFTGDDSRTVGNYILFDVALPALKQLLSDVVSTGIERLLFGGERPGTVRRSYTPYNRYSSSPVSSTNRGTSSVRRSTDLRTPHMDDIVVDNLGTANEIIDALNELIQNYDVATLADLYQLVNITGSYTDENWGWTSMAGARPVRVNGGYLLDLPRLQHLD